MYNRMSLKLRKRNHPSLQECFRGMLLIPAPIWGVKRPQKPSKRQLGMIGGWHARNQREFSVA